ncbi:MAG TPA: metallopeptidase family protein [Anaerovoracaceae bacterium]|nr:metallopeptidase family protein [Anaerovoracaceae bacterium]
MIEIDEVEKILEEIAQELPKEFYKELNGGILLLPEVKYNPAGRNKDLYIMGEYHRGGSMGRYIIIYYGSFQRLYGNLSREKLKKKLAHTLKHEFTHHLESLAGERGLEKKDEEFLREYLSRG